VKNTRKKLRPTSSLVKSALFNILGDLSGLTFVDLFAGTGGVGLEAERRGANVIYVEKDPRRSAELRGKVKGKVVRGDSLRFLKTFKEEADVIFADPPYSFKDYDKLISLALERLSAEGIFILEHDKRRNFSCDQRRVYGDTVISIWRKGK